MQPFAGLKASVSLAAIAVAAVHLIYPALSIDAITVTLFVIAVVPWLQPIFKSIKLPGGWEITLQDLAKRIDNVAGAAQSAERKADLAVSGLPGVSPPEQGTVPDARRPAGDAFDRMARLSAQYARVRATQMAGSQRTLAMTDIVREMIGLAASLDGFDVVARLASSDVGDRLAAYAYLYARPDPALLVDLVTSVTRIETKPFGQYWGLQAIGMNLGDPKGVPEIVVKELSVFANVVQRGTDRHYEVERILQRITA